MKRYLIKNEEKKSVIETEIWTNDSLQVSIEIEQTYRWGEFTIQCEDYIDPSNPAGFVVTDYDIEDQDLDDGCSFCIQNVQSAARELSDSDKEYIISLVETAWEEDMYTGLEDNSWYLDDVETTIVGPLTIEELDDE